MAAKKPSIGMVGPADVFRNQPLGLGVMETLTFLRVYFSERQKARWHAHPRNLFLLSNKNKSGNKKQRQEKASII